MLVANDNQPDVAVVTGHLSVHGWQCHAPNIDAGSRTGAKDAPSVRLTRSTAHATACSADRGSACAPISVMGPSCTLNDCQTYAREPWCDSGQVRRKWTTTTVSPAAPQFIEAFQQVISLTLDR